MSKFSHGVILVGLGALVLSACGAPTTTQPPAATSAPATSAPAATGEIAFMVPGDPVEAKTFQTLVSAFEAQNPGLKVDLITVAGNEENYHARLNTDLTGNAPADVFLLDYDAVASFFGRNVLQAMTPQVAQSSMVHAADFYPKVYQAFEWKGDQMCLPLSAGTLAVYYNVDLFNAAKLTLPQAGWTWDDFKTAATALTKDTNNDGAADQFGIAIEPEFNHLLPFVWQNGGEVLSADATKLTLNSPEATEALQFVVGWTTKDHIAPEAEKAEAEAADSLFENGELGMFIAPRDATLGFRSITKFNWDVAPLPKKAQAANILKSDGICIPAKAKNPAGAWKLVEFLASAEGQKTLAASGLFVPSNMSVAQSPAFLDPNTKPAHNQVWLDEIEHIHVIPPLAEWPELEELANEELEHAYFDTGNAEAAIEEIIDRGQRYLKP